MGSDLINFDLDLNCPVIGVDEVGRGAIAGDVYVAAVYYENLSELQELRECNFLGEINDSKKITAKKRERLTCLVQEYAQCVIASSSVQQINQKGINPAIFNAMRRAVKKLARTMHGKTPLILVDGHMQIPNLDYPQKIIKKGDSHSLHIASASIIAKVKRDKYMEVLHNKVPEYGWMQNKGYGTKVQRDAIKEYGLSEHHRALFVRKILEEHQSEQLKIVS